MCGIIGLIDKGGQMDSENREKIVKNMLNLISHRGGDSDGTVSCGNTTIGHTRLSIVDSSHNADQPFINDGQVLAYNGEIYNHKELRAKYLTDKDIASSSDTATLFELLKIQPIEDALLMVKGMYAFSFLDTKKQSLVLAVDKMAIKPIYYIDTQKYFAWSSEIKAFKALPYFQFQFEDNNLSEYLTFRHISGEQTLLKNIFKMTQGEYLHYSLKSNTYIKKRYFELKKGKTKEHDIEDIIEKSVKSHLMSDAPIGIQLSGGIDSSVISYLAQKNSSSALHSFSIGLDDDNWNEFKYSDLVAKKLGTVHHKIIFTKKDFLDNFEKITYHLDEPIVHPNTVPMFLLAKFARQYTKVLLTGEGADEIFLGYERYIKKEITGDDELLLFNSFSDPRVISKVLKSYNNRFLERRNIIERTAGLNKEDKMSYYDIYTYLPHVLLRQDKSGMAANIENRVPFLYETVVEAGCNLNTKIGNLGGKTLIKNIALRYFPSDFVLRKKCGFGLPITEWLKEEDGLLPLINKLKDSHFVLEYFNIEEIERLTDEHLSGKHDHSAILFSIISLNTWYNIFIH